MDEIVIRGMAKWPDVPAVFGWLCLDRRGNWMIKTLAARFERIGNPAVCAFIGRNYTVDGEGRWYFQNGPQRVFASLDYTPWVYRLDDAGEGFLAHTAAAPCSIEAAYLDDAGGLLLETDLGIGAILDRDLPAVLEHLRDERGGSAEPLLEDLSRGAGVRGRVILHGRILPIASIRTADVERRFGFIARPVPRPGEPEC
jgi:hypothetical protein